VKLKITIDDKVYEVEVEVAEPEPRAASRYTMQSTPLRMPAGQPVTLSTPPSQVANEDKVCRSPISGIVVRAAAQEGQQIQTGDPILVLEAMKMETNITAPISGRISKINVNPGDSVLKDQILAEFD
jgi:methylmalonyl-CoA carboxyltransferase small subunit